MKVLIIDDDNATCDLLETMLQLEDYDTATAGKVQNNDIISLLNQTSPDFLILDYHLQAQDTVIYTQAIRADATWNALPVVMTSAIDRRRQCMAAGANEFILKPFNWEQFIAIVEKVRANP